MSDSQVVSKTYQDATTQLRVDFTYDVNGNVLTETRYSDVAGTQLQGQTVNTYDGNELTSIVQTDGNGNSLASYSYSYDPAGQLSSETDNGVTTNYAYNAVGELVQAGSTTYSYDANGNPIQSGTVIGPNNELLSDGTWNYSYDAAGNQIGKVNIATGETWSYVYNNANQLVSAVDESSSGTVLQQETNTYDVFGQRIGETETTGGSTTTTEMSYDQNGTLYADLNSSGTITTRYISSVTGPDEWLARVDATGGGAWLLSDHLGSVRTVVALTGGTVLDQIAFDPFGNIVSQTNPADMGRLGFQGGELDPVTGEDKFGRRELDPPEREWTTQDPDGLSAGSNPYEFDGDAPTDSVDPSGLKKVPTGIIVSSDQAAIAFQATIIASAQTYLAKGTWSLGNFYVDQDTKRLFVNDTDLETFKMLLENKAASSDPTFRDMLETLLAGGGKLRYLKVEPGSGLMWEQRGRTNPLNGNFVNSDAPTGAVAYTPVVNSLSNARYNYAEGNNVQGALYSVLAVTDVAALAAFAGAGKRTGGPAVTTTVGKETVSQTSSIVARTFEEFMVGRTFGSPQEAQLAWSAYQRGASATTGIVIGHGEAPIQQAVNGWEALRVPQANWTLGINMAWIDGAIAAGKPVRLITPIENVIRDSVTWQEIVHVIARGGRLLGG